MNNAPIRALHVFGLLSRTGGAEKWVLDMLRLRDDRVRFDFLLNVDDGPLVKEVRQLGSDVYLVPFSKSPVPWSWGNPYLAAVRNILRDERYDVVHTHQFDLSGEILRVADQSGVPARIMSIHATEYENPRFHRRLAHLIWGRPWIFRHATSLLPCSDTVACSFVPVGSSAEAKTHTLYTGIDPETFRETLPRRSPAERSRLSREFGIPDHGTVIGHVGRFTRQKNHAFLVDSLGKMMKDDDGLYAVLIGRGELLDAVRLQVRRQGMAKRIILPGPRNDVPDLMTTLFDILLLPSLYEGLPIAGIEGLASGLGVVLSDRISNELNSFFPGRVVQVPLEAPFRRWDEAIRRMIAAKIEPQAALDMLESTPFTIRSSLERLLSFYSVSKIIPSSPGQAQKSF